MRLPALVCLTLAACVASDSDSGGERIADSEAAISPSLERAAGSATRERLFDATGDGMPERFAISATGPRVDSLTVRLTVTDADGVVLRRDQWSSTGYFKYIDPRSLSEKATEDLVVSQLGAILADSNFGAAVAAKIERPTPTPEMRSAIEFDVASDMWREANGLPVGAAIPNTALDSIYRIRPDPARVQRLLDEARAADRYFWYHRGGEDTLVISWSEAEKRFVTVWACC